MSKMNINKPAQSQHSGIGQTSASAFLANRMRGKPKMEEEEEEEEEKKEEPPIQKRVPTKPKPVSNIPKRPTQPKRMTEEEVFTKTDNPFAEEQRIRGGKKVQNVKQYARPDPSKKQVITQDTPIKVNPTGQYNLNFIDWDNEWETVLDRNENDNTSPIYGMSNEVFEAIYEEEMFD